MITGHHVSGEGNAIGRVRPFVRFHAIFWTNWPLTLIFFDCAWVTAIACRRLKVKVTGQSQRSMQKCVCYVSIYGDILWVLIDGRSSRFPSWLWRNQLWDIARQGARCDRDKLCSGAVYRVVVITRPVWPRCSTERGQFFLIGVKLAKYWGARVRAFGVQPRAQPKAVLGWAWKGIWLGSESDSV